MRLKLLVGVEVKVNAPEDPEPRGVLTLNSHQSPAKMLMKLTELKIHAFKIYGKPKKQPFSPCHVSPLCRFSQWTKCDIQVCK